jgi:outer membrane protein TolC
MKSGLITTGSALALLGIIIDASAGEPTKKATKTKAKTTTTAVRSEIATSGYQPIRQFEGRLTLQKAVEIALRQNPEILRAIQEIERTRGLEIEVRAQALPQISLTGSYTQQDRRLIEGGGGGGAGGSSGNVDFSQFSDFNNTTTVGPQAAATTTSNTDSQNATATVLEELLKALGSSGEQGSTIQDKSWRVAFEARQVIYAGGQVRAALNIARLTEDNSYYNLRDTIDRVISDVRQQFYAVLAFRALITVQEEAVNLAEQQLTDQRNRFDAGTVPRFNVLRAEVELANVQPNLIRARNDYLLSQLQLAKSLGLDPGPGGKPTFFAVGDLTVSGRYLSLDDALALARARRPFLKIQRQQILIEVQQIKVAQAGYKPRIDANAGYEFRNRRTSDDLGDVVDGWFFGFTGSWDIFDGFETFGQVKQARARLEAARVNYNDSVQQVELEVQTAFANLAQARETIQSQQKNVEQAREATRLAQERLSAGAGTQLDVLDARTALTRAQVTELQARADYNRTLAEYDRATAINTVYDDSWRDPLAKTERSIMEKIASIGFPKPGTAEFEKREAAREARDARATSTTVQTTKKAGTRVERVSDGKSSR